MDRRNALATLSGVAVATAFLTLDRGAALAQQATAPAGQMPAMDAASYKMHTLMAGTFSKQTSELAQAQANHAKVKEFAKFEADEQTSIAQVLTDTANPPPAPLDQAHQAKLAKLQGLSGKAFDVAYVRGQIEGHQELYEIQQAFLSSAPTDRDREHIAVLARTVIQMHLTMLQDLQGQLGSA